MTNNWKKSVLLIAFLAFPAGSSYRLEGYTFGGGGANKTNSSNYQIQGRLGQVGGDKSVGVSYGLGAGLAWQRQAGVPGAPALVNDGNYYDRLRLTVNEGGNPDDTKYAIAISGNGFSTTNYVKSDQSIGSSLTLSDYQTYTQWGGGSGFLVTGLSAGTTYVTKIKAMQGSFTESDWGPTATAGTSTSSLTFDIDVSATDSDTDSPYSLTLGDLIPGDIITSSSRVWVDFGTNSSTGGNVYVYGQNGGLYSVMANDSIGATTADLADVSQGFGAQGIGATQTTGGPLLISSPYNGSGSTVGLIDTLVRGIFVSNGALTNGRASFVVKAKSANTTTSASDYSEVLTVVASVNY